MDRDECIQKLNGFDQLLEWQFDANYDVHDKAVLRRLINESAQEVKSILFRTGCMIRVNAAPPSATGGAMLNGADPFEMIFESYYGASVIPMLRDAIQKSIGTVKSYPVGPLPEDENPAQETPLVVPEKMTLSWLVDNVPIKYWLMSVGLLLAAFSLGLKAANIPFFKSILGAL